MLIFTNRTMQASADESAFGAGFSQGSETLGMATVTRKGKKGWSVKDIDTDVDDADSKKALVPIFQGEAPVLVYIHGFNNTPAKCFERCLKLETLYGVQVVGFSWPAEGYQADGTIGPGVISSADPGDENDLGAVKVGNRLESPIQSMIHRYHQAGLNGKNSVDALARFLRMVAAARLDANAQPFTAAAHSLGAQFLQYSLDIPAVAESLATARNVVFLAPCVRASDHRNWIGKIRPISQLFVTFNKGDSVLAGAAVADLDLGSNSQLKLGTDPTPDRFRAPYMRYISATNAMDGFGGHGYFAQDKMPKNMQTVFGRIFSSKRDIEAGEIDRKIYGIKGDEDGLTCYFNAP